jgi:hypothetical protein
MKLAPVLHASILSLGLLGLVTLAPSPAQACPKGDIRVHVCVKWAGHKGEALKITGKCLQYAGYKCQPRNPVIK